MEEDIDYLAINKQSWNARTISHLKSEFYDVEGFLNGKTSLNSVELDLLGDIKGKKILHLQCHFGQDTISLARMGANITGVDLSDKAIESARELAAKSEVDTTFICCDIYDLPNFLDEQFDIVYTSYGVIGWLPDMAKWAKIIERYMIPGGKFVFVEFHPVVWMFDDDFKEIKYKYSKSEPIIEIETGTYADKDADITEQCVTWNHGMAEVINNLLKAGLNLSSIAEHDYSPYNCFSGTNEFAPNKFRIKHLDNKIPMLYSLVAVK